MHTFYYIDWSRTDALQHRAMQDVIPDPIANRSSEVVQNKQPYIANTTIQRVKGIEIGRHVEVKDGGPAYYGIVVGVTSDNEHYEIRIGGTDRKVTVPENQVKLSYAFDSVLLTQKAVISTIEPLDKDKEVQAYSNEDAIGKELVEAADKIKGELEKDTAKHTIAMFNFLHRYAPKIENVVRAAFEVIKSDNIEQRRDYLNKLQDLMFPRLGDRGLFAGDEDRGLIILDALSIGQWLEEGKPLLKSKAGEAKDNTMNLSYFLDNYSRNLDAKSYGRRLLSLREAQVSGGPTDYGNVVELSGILTISKDDKDYSFLYPKTFATVEDPVKDLVKDQQVILSYEKADKTYRVKVVKINTESVTVEILQ